MNSADHAHGHNMSHDMLHHAHVATDALVAADPLLFAGFAAILAFSAVSSLHCGVMCGPLVCARLGPEASLRKSGIWLYNLGRAISYPLLGAVLGLSGRTLLAAASDIGRFASLALGAFFVAAALVVFAGKGRFLTQRLSRGAQRIISPVLTRMGSRSLGAQMLMLGLLTVILPCMTLTPVLLLAAASDSPAYGAALLGAFYCGTLPMMLIAPVVPVRLSARLSPRLIPWISSILLMIAGVVTLLRVYH